MIKLDSSEVGIYFTSDTHAYHKNIIRGTSEWEGAGMSARDFDTIDKMTDTIVNGINNCVNEDDVLFHLGDWSFGGFENILKFRNRLVCKNIHLIGGNHDLHIYNDKLLDKTNGVYAKSLFTSFSEGAKLIQVDKLLVMMSHFPMREARFDKESIYIHGHCHGKDNIINMKSGILDVGVDSAFKILGEYKPFKFNEIKEITKLWLK